MVFGLRISHFIGFRTCDLWTYITGGRKYFPQVSADLFFAVIIIILKYQDLKREIMTVWQLRKVLVVPMVIGALGAVTSNFRRYLDSVSCKLTVSNLQKTALFGSAHILQKVLEI